MIVEDTSTSYGATFPRGFEEGKVHFPMVRAGELVSLNYGKSLVERTRSPGSVPVYGTNGQCGWNGQALRDGPTVVLGRKGMGPLGVEWCNGPFWVIDTAYYVTKNRPDLDLKFFYYLVKYIGLNHLKDGTSNPSLSRDTFSSQLLPLPTNREQQQIAGILGSLDDKIDLNRRMNATLEAMARAIFKSWFVDFYPVRAKIEGRRPVGVDAETAALFPNRMEESPAGRLPIGWRFEPLEKLVVVAKGLSYKGSGLSKRGLPMHNLNSVNEGGGYKYEGIKFYSGEYQDRHIVRPGDVIVTNTEQGFDYLLIGYPAIVPKRFGDFGLFTHHIFRVRPLAGSPLTSRFVYLALFDSRLRDDVVGYTNGTTVNMLSADGLRRPLVVVPPEPIVQAADRIFTSLLAKTEANVEENDTLVALRDALLPKLLSGEIRVKQAEALVESVS